MSRVRFFAIQSCKSLLPCRKTSSLFEPLSVFHLPSYQRSIRTSSTVRLLQFPNFSLGNGHGIKYRAFASATNRRNQLQPPGTDEKVAQAQPPPPKPSTTPPKTTPPPILPSILSSLPPTLKHENIYTLPNALTFSRLLAAPAIGYLVLHDSHLWAAGLFFYASITDLVDGWLARRWNQQTVVGSVVDPLADKALMTILTVCLAIKGGLPVWLATLILGRDISLGIAAIYYRYASLPAPKTFSRYWDFSLPSAEVHPTTISKYNTFLQFLLIGAITVMPVAGPTIDAGIHMLSSVGAADGAAHAGGLLHGVNVETLMDAARWIVAGTTVWSGASYLYARNAVKILGSGTEMEKKRIIRRGRGVIAASFVACGVVAWALEGGMG